MKSEKKLMKTVSYSIKATIVLMLILFVIGISEVVNAQTNNGVTKKSVAVTIDDLPIAGGARKCSVDEQKLILIKLVESLKKTKAPIIGFINEDQLYSNDKINEEKINFLKTWLTAGFDLGNHTYSHQSANQIPVEEFEKEILKGEKICKTLVKDYIKEYVYFRHPFLNTGRSLAVKEEIESFLKRNGYTIAPVTIDNSEWIYAAAYEKAFLENNREIEAKIAATYLDYMKQKVEWYEKKSDELFGRSINHILLIHANRLNADYVEKLLEMIRNRGYNFISIKEALEDKAYESKDTFIKAGGISWIDRWALTAGKTKDFFISEPRADKWVMDYAGIDSE